jgi:hypothetical protein
MRDYCIEMGLYFDEQGKLRRRVVRDREVVRVPLDRGSRGRFAIAPPASSRAITAARSRTKPRPSARPRWGRRPSCRCEGLRMCAPPR